MLQANPSENEGLNDVVQAAQDTDAALQASDPDVEKGTDEEEAEPEQTPGPEQDPSASGS